MGLWDGRIETKEEAKEREEFWARRERELQKSLARRTKSGKCDILKIKPSDYMTDHGYNYCVKQGYKMDHPRSVDEMGHIGASGVPYMPTRSKKNGYLVDTLVISADKDACVAKARAIASKFKSEGYDTEIITRVTEHARPYHKEPHEVTSAIYKSKSKVKK